MSTDFMYIGKMNKKYILYYSFSYVLNYGIDGPEGQRYPNPEIIDGILKYLKSE